MDTNYRMFVIETANQDTERLSLQIKESFPSAQIDEMPELQKMEVWIEDGRVDVSFILGKIKQIVGNRTPSNVLWKQ